MNIEPNPIPILKEILKELVEIKELLENQTAGKKLKRLFGT